MSSCVVDSALNNPIICFQEIFFMLTTHIKRLSQIVTIVTGWHSVHKMTQTGRLAARLTLSPKLFSIFSEGQTHTVTHFALRVKLDSQYIKISTLWTSLCNRKKTSQKKKKNADWLHQILIVAHYCLLNLKWQWFSFAMYDTRLTWYWQVFVDSSYCCYVSGRFSKGGATVLCGYKCTYAYIFKYTILKRRSVLHVL